MRSPILSKPNKMNMEMRSLFLQGEARISVEVDTNNQQQTTNNKQPKTNNKY
ncbi:MAG: hypothetical protein F6K41_25910 [Symploca sp. SIO3E6]|nr:hypothetical protein [Caldora sp. SIO3E6]